MTEDRSALRAQRRAEKKAAKKSATGYLREFCASDEGKEWLANAGQLGEALLTLFPAKVAKAGSSEPAERKPAKYELVWNYIAERGTVTDLEMFQEFKMGVAETRKVLREYMKKAEKKGEPVNISIDRTEDGEGWSCKLAG